MPLRRIRVKGKQVFKTVYDEAVFVMYIIVFLTIWYGFDEIQDQREARTKLNAIVDYELCKQDDNQNHKLRQYIAETFHASERLMLTRPDLSPRQKEKLSDFYRERIDTVINDFPDLPCEKVLNSDISP